MSKAYIDEVDKDVSILKIYVVPGSSKNEIIGLYGEDNRLKIKTNAIAEGGKANKEIISFLSKFLKISKSNFEIKRGLTSRQKDVLVNASSRTLNDAFSMY